MTTESFLKESTSKKITFLKKVTPSKSILKILKDSVLEKLDKNMQVNDEGKL